MAGAVLSALGWGVPSAIPSPPSPPQVARQLRVPPARWAGFALLFALPLLACLQVFGPQPETVESEGGGVKLAVTFVPRSRFSVQEQMRVQITRQAGGRAGPLRVEIARAYLSRFSILAATPAPAEVNAEAFVFSLPAASTADGSGVVIELQGEAYGPARGEARVVWDGGETAARVEFTSFIFP